MSGRPFLRLREILAAMMAGVRLNTVRLEARAGRPLLCKRRRWYAPLVIPFGNFVSQRRSVPVRVLNAAQWIARERICAVHCRGSDLEINPAGELCQSVAAGEPLHLLLGNTELDWGRALDAVAAAARALRAFHRLTLAGEGAPASHGDATVRNVAVDPHDMLATWFDFDLSHDPCSPPHARHADDLRALIFSALPHLPAEQIAPMAKSAVAAYAESDVLAELSRQLDSGRLNRDFYHLAQTLAPAPARAACREAVLQAILRQEE